MRIFLHAIKELPHAEERPKGASRSTHRLAAAFFDRSGQFPDSLLRRDDKENEALSAELCQIVCEALHCASAKPT
jgi:hypothetical protein